MVLRFDQVDEDSEAYLAMLNYLVGKHRCGVIKSGYHGIKDMYLLPLLRHNPVAPQLLPFDGPGQLLTFLTSCNGCSKKREVL